MTLQVFPEGRFKTRTKRKEAQATMKKFAFIVHPRNLKDVHRVFPFTKFWPDKAVYGWVRLTRRLPRLWLCSSFDVHGAAKGYIIASPLTAGQILEFDLRFVRKTLLNTVIYAQNRLGAEVIGLGALTASVTDAGRWFVKQPEVKASITHGDSFSVAIAMEGIKRILEKKRGTVAITGATGIIGSGLARILSGNGNRLLLIGRNSRKLKTLAQGLPSTDVTVTTDVKACHQADIIIAATSHSDAMFTGEHLKQGAVIYDVCQPEAVSPSVLRKRPDVVRIDGSLASIPGIDLKFEMGPPKGATFACLAETMIQTLEKMHEHRVGPVDLSYIDAVQQAGEKYGFSHAPFTCFGQQLNSIFGEM